MTGVAIATLPKETDTLLCPPPPPPRRHIQNMWSSHRTVLGHWSLFPPMHKGRGGSSKVLSLRSDLLAVGRTPCKGVTGRDSLW